MGMSTKPLNVDTYKPDKDLKTNIMVTSFMHSTSIMTELVREWYLDRMPKDLYKTIYVEGKHVYTDFKQYREHDSKIKRPKPALAINPNVVYDYDRDMHDIHPEGLHIVHFPGYDEFSFYKDFVHDSYMGVQMGELQVEYTFLTRVETRAQQLDLFNYMNKAMGIGFASKYFIDVDYQLPKEMIHAIAKENGFEIVNGEVNDIIGFLNLLNSRSEYPIRYKLRGVNRQKDYFLRYMDCTFKIDHTDKLSVNDGDTYGDLKDNFDIEMRISALLPIPKLFAYFSKYKYNFGSIFSVGADPEKVLEYKVSLVENSQLNSRGWNQYLVTEYYKDEFDPKSTQLEVIEIGELLHELRVDDIINNNNASGISSDIFIDFELKNGEDIIPYNVDWNKCTINTLKPLIAQNTLIAMYIDTKYLSEQRELIDHISDNRVKTKEDSRV